MFNGNTYMDSLQWFVINKCSTQIYNLHSSQWKLEKSRIFTNFVNSFFKFVKIRDFPEFSKFVKFVFSVYDLDRSDKSAHKKWLVIDQLIKSGEQGHEKVHNRHITYRTVQLQSSHNSEHAKDIAEWRLLCRSQFAVDTPRLWRKYLSLTRSPKLRTVKQETKKHHSVVWCEVYFQSLEPFRRRSQVWWRTDGQTDRRRERENGL